MQPTHLTTSCPSFPALLLIPLLCRHSPVPTITWRKINGNIPKKARLRKSQAVLEIPNIQLEDSGTYECKAENPRGGTAFKGHLQVYSESGASSLNRPPVLALNLQPSAVTREWWGGGRRAAFLERCFNQPFNFSFFLNNQLVFTFLSNFFFFFKWFSLYVPSHLL